MKNMLIALVMLASPALMAKPAHAHHSATPVWACAFHALHVMDNRYYVIVRGGTVDAYGTMTCTAWNTQSVTANVHIALEQMGIGLGFGFPVNNGTFDLLQVKVGVATPAGMIGSYQLSVGPGLTLIGARIGFDGGIVTNPDGSVAAVLQVSVEQMMGIGVDLTGSRMTISPWQ